MACPSGKRSYPTQELAEEALIQAHTAYEYPEGQGPLAVYQCDECGEFHLTSRGPINERLAAYIAEGKLKLHKEARRWEDRFRGKH